MTEPQNPFSETFALADTDYVGTILADEHDDGTVFSDALEALFETAMTTLAEQMPDDDEEQANALMSAEVQRLMMLCFKAGMIYQHEVGAPENNEIQIPVFIDADQAGQLVSELVKGDPLLRLVVHRGSN